MEEIMNMPTENLIAVFAGLCVALVSLVQMLVKR